MLLLRKISYLIIMTNFNGINPWLNALNYLNAAQNKANGANQNAQTAQNSQSAQQSANANLANLANLSTNVFVKDVTNYLGQTQVNQAEQIMTPDMLKMNNEVVQKYLQSLLNMPESLDKVFNNINPKEMNTQGYQFLKLFVENMINNKELSQLLNQNSNDAIQKLLNVITQSLKQGNNVAQLKEILSVLNTIHTTSSVNTNTLRELFLLYIPINYQVFKEDSNFDKITGENEDSIKESTLSILFETYNFSNILVTLTDSEGKVYLEIKAGADFPFTSFKKIVTTMAAENSINVFCDFVKIKDVGTKGQKQNFKIVSNDFVPVNILNVSNIVIKTIFKLDYNMEAIEA